jgi:hypothetical protein
MQETPAHGTASQEVAAYLLEGRSVLLYRGADAESEALRQVAGWLSSRRGLLDAAVVERIQQEMSDGMVAELERAADLLRADGYAREADAVLPFVPLLRQMLELKAACDRMHRGYNRLRSVTDEAEARG